MDDDLRTVIVEFLDDISGIELYKVDLELTAEELEKYLNKRGYAFYDERGRKPVKL